MIPTNFYLSVQTESPYKSKFLCAYDLPQVPAVGNRVLIENQRRYRVMEVDWSITTDKDRPNAVVTLAFVYMVED